MNLETGTIMERHFGLPLAFAAALHGALFFGFTKTPRPAPAAELPTKLMTFILPPPPDEPPIPPEETTSTSSQKQLPDPPALDRQVEPPVVDVPSVFTISPPPIDTVDTSALREIVKVPVAVRNGDGTSPWGLSVIPSDLLDNSPRARLQSAPLFPFEAKREGLSGEVIVEFLVDEGGRVLEPRVVSSTHRIFEDASLRAVTKWVFEPGRRNGRVVRFRMAVPVVFRLGE